MPNQPKAGRPRRTLDWASTLRYNLPVSFVKDRDIHTALFLAGTSAVDMVMHAIREYITNHPDQTGYAIDPAVQQRVAANALAIAMGIDGVHAATPTSVISSPVAPSSVPAVQTWVTPQQNTSPNHVEASRPIPRDDMISRLRSAIPTAQELAVTPARAPDNPVPRVGLESDFNFPDENGLPAIDEEARRLDVAHQFAINQLRDA